VIDFTGVTKQYPDGTVAVDDLTLQVPDGTLTVFVGPSGCGKTTSMRMINRMIEPTSGTLTVNGDDVIKVDPVKLRLGIGYVIQSAGLMPHQRVVDNVATVPVLRGESRRTARKLAMGVLERVGLDPKLANRFPAVRRPAAACRRCTGTGRRSADPVDGRTVQRRRPRRP
jgi:osmoprotectant transport system ATP-binding protein